MKPKKMKYRHTARILWRGYFPVDMLRYDNCRLLNEADRMLIFVPETESIRLIRSDDMKEVVVVKETDWKDPNPFTVARWSSFGAGCGEIKTEKL